MVAVKIVACELRQHRDTDHWRREAQGTETMTRWYIIQPRTKIIYVAREIAQRLVSKNKSTSEAW